MFFRCSEVHQKLRSVIPCTYLMYSHVRYEILHLTTTHAFAESQPKNILHQQHTKKHPQRCTTNGNASSTNTAATAAETITSHCQSRCQRHCSNKRSDAITANANVILPPLSNAAYDCSAADTAPATVLRSTANAAETTTVAYNPATLETAFS